MLPACFLGEVLTPNHLHPGPQNGNQSGSHPPEVLRKATWEREDRAKEVVLVEEWEACQQ